MVKRMLIDATHAEETRVVVLDGTRLEEFDVETSTKKQIKGNIYLAKVVRVEPSLQAAFVDYGGNRHGFLAFSEIHPDYYQIPVADRERLIAEQERHEREEEERNARRRARQQAQAASAQTGGEGQPGDGQAGAQSGEQGEGAHEGHGHDDDGHGGHDHGDHHHDDHAHDHHDHHADDHQHDHGHDDHHDGDAIPLAFIPPAITSALPSDDEHDEHHDDHHDEADHDDTAHNDAAAEGASESAAGENGGLAEGAEPGIETTGENTGAENGAGENGGGENANGENGNGDAPQRREKSVVETVGGDDDEEEEGRDDSGRRRFVASRHYKIQEVIKRRQIMLIQVVKEERGNKGAALTTYLSLAGRYCVLMPNSVRGGGVSRKITSAQDRRRLKQILGDLELPANMGVILRTAGSERSRAEINRDYEYLQRTWNSIREVTMQSRAPALIHEEASLIKRAIRDIYSRDLEEVWVDGEEGYKTAKDFMRMLTPSHAKKVQRYKDDIIPLYHRYQVETQMESINSPVVQLRSGGSIVFAQTEALVAIDVNSGRATKERHIEETAFKTNMEAAEEIARQLRLRDLAGLIVIDFIDMEDNRNNHAVERKLKEALKADRARIQVGRISHFGLLELSRQRLRPSLIEANFRPCSHCAGTGMIRSTESAAVHSLRMLEEEGVRQRSSEVTITVHPDVALYLLNYKREALAIIEARYGLKIFVLGDPHLIPPNLRLDRVKSMRGPGEGEARELPPPVREIAPPEPEEEDEATDDAESEEEAAASEPRSHGQPRNDGQPRGESEEDGARRKRRRKRRRGRGGEDRGDGPRHERHDGQRHEGQRHEGQRHDGPRPEGQRQEGPRAEGEQSAESPDAVQDGQPRAEGQESGRPEPQGRDGEARRRRRGRRGGRRRRRGNGEPGEQQGGEHLGGERHGGEHQSTVGGETSQSDSNAQPNAGPWPEMHTPAPEPTTAPAHVDLAGVDGAAEVRNGNGPSRFFRAIKEGVLGRPAEPRPPEQRAEPPRAEPRVEARPDPVPAPVMQAQPQAEPEPSGPPRKGWWSNKT